MKKLSFILFFLPLFLFSQTEVQLNNSYKKIALVIGNSNYELGNLKNAINDARLIKEVLDSLNFNVHYYEDLDREGMINAVKLFAKELTNYHVSFTYFAGHGIGVDNQNYLVPIGADLKDIHDVTDNCVSSNVIHRYYTSIPGTGIDSSRVDILVLDACRNNPFNQQINRSVGGRMSKGLIDERTPNGSFVAYSTQYGDVASDGGDDKNSIYTRMLAESLLYPEFSIVQIFRNVRGEVLKRTKNAQYPVWKDELELHSDIYLFQITEKTNQPYQLDSLHSTKEIYSFLLDYYNALSKGDIKYLRYFYADTLSRYFSESKITSDKLLKGLDINSKEHISRYIIDSNSITPELISETEIYLLWKINPSFNCIGEFPDSIDIGGKLILDSDGDGLIDEYDKCPYDKGTVKNKGCPDTITGQMVSMDTITWELTVMENKLNHQVKILSIFETTNNNSSWLSTEGNLVVPNALYADHSSEEYAIFLPKGYLLKEYHLQIFDHWGNLVFETQLINDKGCPIEPWDGTIFGEVPAPQGTYIWKIKAIFKNGSIWEGENGQVSGPLYLIR